MVILSRKTAEQNPASTAALRRVAINLNQRRALRHPAGAPASAASVKKMREEIMNGTFAARVPSWISVPIHAEIIAHR